jgi:Raf kinase inhibitor-like YbhB/YbcL family protein
MKLTSPEFKHGADIPKKFSCKGSDINPELHIEGIPPESKSLALIVDDPDAPGKTFVHWVVFNMPLKDKIGENSVPGLQGMNDFGNINYGGPCPPSGAHRYFFKLYALDKELDLQEGATKQDVEQAMQGNILAECELMGLFAK